MKERPILFSTPMVRAILPGDKTKTRRIVKWGRVHMDGISPDMCNEDGYKALSNDRKLTAVAPWTKQALELLVCPYGKPGDRLWVRETWAASWIYNDVKASLASSTHPDDNRWYAADPAGTPGTHGCPSKGHIGKWRPSIHMPRQASRITLEIVAVHVERLEDISEEDAKAEGAPCITWGECVLIPDKFCRNGFMPSLDRSSHIAGFINLWESINGEGSWDANPWVWVIEFKRIPQ